MRRCCADVATQSAAEQLPSSASSPSPLDPTAPSISLSGVQALASERASHFTSCESLAWDRTADGATPDTRAGAASADGLQPTARRSASGAEWHCDAPDREPVVAEIARRGPCAQDAATDTCFEGVFSAATSPSGQQGDISLAGGMSGGAAVPATDESSFAMRGPASAWDGGSAAALPSGCTLWHEFGAGAAPPVLTIPDSPPAARSLTASGSLGGPAAGRGSLADPTPLATAQTVATLSTRSAPLSAATPHTGAATPGADGGLPTRAVRRTGESQDADGAVSASGGFAERFGGALAGGAMPSAQSALSGDIVDAVVAEPFSRDPLLHGGAAAAARRSAPNGGASGRYDSAANSPPPAASAPFAERAPPPPVATRTASHRPPHSPAATSPHPLSPHPRPRLRPSVSPTRSPAQSPQGGGMLADARADVREALCSALTRLTTMPVLAPEAMRAHMASFEARGAAAPPSPVWPPAAPRTDAFSAARAAPTPDPRSADPTSGAQCEGEPVLAERVVHMGGGEALEHARSIERTTYDAIVSVRPRLLCPGFADNANAPLRAVPRRL